jgi:hypothetical protein
MTVAGTLRAATDQLGAFPFVAIVTSDESDRLIYQGPLWIAADGKRADAYDVQFFNP